MCIGYCFPFSLTIKEWILGGSFLILLIVAIWKDVIGEKKWSKFREEAIERVRGKGKIYRYIHFFQKLLHYIFRGTVQNQILNPYFLFPSLILFWVFGINNWELKDLVLATTLIVILWYSKETLFLREEQRASNRIAKKSLVWSLTPGLTMRWQKEGGSLRSYSYRLILSNQGKGCALRPRLEIIGKLAREYELDLYGVNAISPGDWVSVGLKRGFEEVSSERFHPSVKINEDISSPIPVKIMFDSIESKKKKRKEPTLYTEIEIGNPGKAVKIKNIKWE